MFSYISLLLLPLVCLRKWNLMNNFNEQTNKKIQSRLNDICFGFSISQVKFFSQAVVFIATEN